MKTRDERGVALITAVLMLGMMSALLIGVTALAVSEQRSRFQNRDRTQAFEAAHSGLEKLTNDLGDLFSLTYAPTDAQIAALKTQMPAFPGVKYDLPGGSTGSGYQIEKKATQTRTLTTGAFSGLTALVTPYDATVTAKTLAASETSLRRTMNTVAIPVFQFGIFSEMDLSYFPGPDFNFGGRVHTNGNLFLAKGSGSELILGDRVTAVKEVVRQKLANAHPITTGYTGTVKVLTVDGGCTTTTATTCRPLTPTEGSVVDMPNSAVNTSWPSISATTYASHIMNGRTGATTLNLPLTGDGARPIDLIRRPAVGENTSNPTLFSQRYYQYASLRVLLSDDPADITSLPTIDTSKAPVNLKLLGPNTFATTYPLNPNIARSPSSGLTDYLVPANTPTISGYLKIEKQTSTKTWVDVTEEILSVGYAGRRLDQSCAEINPGAIIRLQRLRRGYTTEATFNSCGLKSGAVTTTGASYFPNILFDAREALTRDSAPSVAVTVAPPLLLGGVMHYVELDIANLRLWLMGQTNIMKETGYVFYFSDRRGNHQTNAISGNETAAYGYEDVVNPTSSAGTRNSSLDVAEDVNGDEVLNMYGFTTQPAIVTAAGTTTTGKLNQTATAETQLTQNEAERNPTVLFRRALKLVHGARAQMLPGTPLGLTVAAENAVYIEGDYNADSTEANTYTKDHVACAVIADAVTLLSRNWNDMNSLMSVAASPGPGKSPYNTSNRATTLATTYRTAIIAGKSMTFEKPGWSTVNDFGTDGGTHNFLRYLEAWGSTSIYYRGSMVSFFYSQQATGLFKCCATVYGAPVRVYTFDTEFLDPNKLPPRTPMVRDINTTGFSKLSAPPSP
jgi:hypothetical protein